MSANRSTNFFARQQHARRSCRNQIILFIFAVSTIVLVTTLVIRLAWYLYITHQAYTLISAAKAQSYHQKLSTFTFFDPAFFLFVAMAIVIIILAASVYKMHTLQKGGGAVAKMLGGRLISPETADQDERRLLNVVEEMSIASGIPVPQVFVMDQEYNINAFAAGLEFNDAAVTVTKGALDKLTRDELQGVIAHEFSHILNGDMRLNVQLIGILFGILFLGIAGQQIVSRGRIAIRFGFSSIHAVAVMAGGVCLLCIGYIGSFLGRLIQCAVCRQKEFLADASAVQFTRNPLGLAGALKKIGGSVFGSRIIWLGTKQASHLFFSESNPDELFTFLDTHPPLIERIQLLDPAFDGKFPKIKDDKAIPMVLAKYRSEYRGNALNIPARSSILVAIPAEVINRVGNPTKENFGQGRVLLSSMPEEIHEAVKTPRGAVSIIYSLLMDGDPSLRNLRTSALERTLVLQGRIDSVLELAEQLSGLQMEFRLPAIEMAMPALKGLTSMEKRNFLLILQSLANADGKVSLFELSVSWILDKYLNPSEELFRSVTIFSYSRVGLDIVVLLQALACAGNAGDSVKAKNAFQAGVVRIPELAARKPTFSNQGNASYARVNTALTRLNDASFKIKESVMDACAHCAFADETISYEEGELLRVVALALGCPVPPFLPKTPAPDAA